MIEPNRIAAGVARNLLKRAGPNTDPNPLIEEAFRRGFRLASMRIPWKSCASSQGRAAPMLWTLTRLWRGRYRLDARHAAALFFGVASSLGFA